MKSREMLLATLANLATTSNKRMDATAMNEGATKAGCF